MRKHPSSPIAPMRFPSCPVAFRLTPFPPLRLSRLFLGADRKRRVGRGSKEVGGGPAAPYLLRSTSPPPACPPQVVESRQLPGEGQGWGQSMPQPRRRIPRIARRFVHKLLARGKGPYPGSLKKFISFIARPRSPLSLSFPAENDVMALTFPVTTSR